MRFEEFLISILPVAMFSGVVYLFVQRWLCHPDVERGLHWRGLMLKIGCWPVYVYGTILAVLDRNVPYIPTSKEAQRGAFGRLAAPHLVVLMLYVGTVIYVVWTRLSQVSEAELMLTSEAVWGMMGFETLSMLMLGGVLYAAREATQPPAGNAWDAVDLTTEPWR